MGIRHCLFPGGEACSPRKAHAGRWAHPKPSESPCRAQGQSEAFGNAPAACKANPKPSECPCSVQGQSEAFGNAPAERRAILKRSGSSCSVQGQSEAFGNAPAACLANLKPSEMLLQSAGRNLAREGRPCSVQGLSYDKGGVHRGALRLRRACYNRQPIPAAGARPRPGVSSVRRRPWAHTCWSGTSPRSA